MSAESSLDRWIAELMDCKPLTEAEVESLCEKVRAAATFAGNSSPTCLQAVPACAWRARLPVHPGGELHLPCTDL